MGHRVKMSFSKMSLDLIAVAFISLAAQGASIDRLRDTARKFADADSSISADTPAVQADKKVARTMPKESQVAQANASAKSGNVGKVHSPPILALEDMINKSNAQPVHPANQVLEENTSTAYDLVEKDVQTTAANWSEVDSTI